MSHPINDNKLSAKPRPSFYKIIHAAVLEDRILGLPRKFAREFGNELSDMVVLRVPKGELWDVKLKRVDEEIYLHEGLQDFIENYSISVGHFLVFRYDGVSQFYVIVCDMTGCEIEYKSEKHSRDRGHFFAEKENDPSPKDRHLHAEGGALQAAQALKLENPSFMVTMNASYINTYLAIPARFTKKYFITQVESVTLTVPDGRTWEIGCFVDHARGYYKLVKGWKGFTYQMNLKVGNVSVFELIRDKNFIVHIFGSA